MEAAEPFKEELIRRAVFVIPIPMFGEISGMFGEISGRTATIPGLGLLSGS